jgi:serine/threonine-protein kinase
MRNLIGQQLGQYEVVELLGKGGMAAVYRARQVTMGRDVAIKVLEPGLTDSAEFLKRFARETRAVSKLSHAHILKVFDFGQQDDLVYLVMELLGGGSLADQIAAGPLPLPMIRRVLEQVASALDYAHSKGIVHRDLKPQNILLDESGNAFLTDFGIVKLVDETSRLTEPGSVVGTPAYIAPEHWLGQQVDARADVYALGVVLFEMLTGRLPFQGDTLYSMMQLHIHELPPPVSSLRRELSPALAQVIDRALAKEPAMRYDSAGALAAAFVTAISEPPAPAQPAAPASPDPGATSALPHYDAGPEPVQTAPVPAGRAPGAAPRTPSVYDTVPVSIGSPLPAKPAKPSGAPPARTTTQPPAQPAEAGARSRLTVIAGGVALVALAVIALLALAGGGGGPDPVAQTATESAILALTPSQTPTITDTPPALVAIRVTDTVTPSRTPTFTLTFTPSATATPTPTPLPTETPPPTLTATHTATHTPLPTATDTPDAAATAIVQITATIEAAGATARAVVTAGRQIHGPEAGDLLHVAGSAIVGQWSEVRVADFVVEATFQNPYRTDEGTWDYGFLFRSASAGGDQYRLLVRSRGDLALVLRTGGSSSLVANIEVPGLDTSAGGRNALRLAVFGPAADLYVNDAFVARLDVSAVRSAGDVAVATGIIGDNRLPGRVTRFEGFSIWTPR